MMWVREPNHSVCAPARQPGSAGQDCQKSLRCYGFSSRNGGGDGVKIITSKFLNVNGTENECIGEADKVKCPGEAIFPP